MFLLYTIKVYEMFFIPLPLHLKLAVWKILRIFAPDKPSK